MRDRLGREIDYARLSITARCNLRCVYCMPQGAPCPADALTTDELERAARLLASLGVRHFRITGGEPMARGDCLTLVRRIAALPGAQSVSMTTNGLLLAGRMRQAREAGLSAVNISIDTLNPAAYARITRGGDVRAALAALDEAVGAGLRVRVNAVPVRGYSEDGIQAVARLARSRPIDVRFIELMPVGCGRALSPVPIDEVRARLVRAFGPLRPDEAAHGHGPAVYAKPEGFAGSLGFIGALSHAFCARCNRVRLTADGFLKLCLNRPDGLDLRALLRSGLPDAAIADAMRAAIENKPACHGFGQTDAADARRMNEIGG